MLVGTCNSCVQGFPLESWRSHIHHVMSSVMGNRALRPLSLTYPKKNWQAGPRKFFFGYNPDYDKLYSAAFTLHRLYPLAGVIPKEGLAGPRMPILLMSHYESPCYKHGNMYNQSSTLTIFTIEYYRKSALSLVKRLCLIDIYIWND